MAWIPYVIVGDNHGDMIDPKARKAFLSFCDDFKPKLRVHLGDAIDLRAWRRGASSADQADSMQADYDAGIQFLRDMQADVWLLGNHDHRLWITAKDGRGPMRDYANQIIDDIADITAEMGCRVIPWGVRQGVYELGKVHAGGYRLVHGYKAGITATQMEARTWFRAIHAHTHTVGTFVAPTYDNSEAHGIGCICRLDHEYSLGNEASLRQEHGWGYGHVNDRTGAVHFNHARKIGNTWFYGTQMGGN